MPIPDDFWHTLSQVMRVDQLLRDPANCLTYSYDNGRHRAMPLGVILAETTEQIIALVRLCGYYHIPITSRGRGTGTPGGALASPNGLILSFERMTRIVAFNPANRTMTIEAGTLNQSVQDLAATANLFWAPDPSSAAFCTIGGNIAYNAGGPRAVKYGATRDNVLAISAITGAGELIETGFNLAKWTCGYDLGRLLIGSEGTLAIIVSATLKLLPLQPAKATLQAWFHSTLAAAELIPTLLQCPALPCAIEYMDSACLDLLRDHSDLAIPLDAHALLIIEIDGLTSAMAEAVTRLTALCQQAGAIAIDSAQDSVTREKLWRVRKALSPTLRQLAPYKINEDIVVPIDQLPTLIAKLADLATHYQWTMVNFGHIGSGNLHVNILLDQIDNTIQKRVDLYLKDLFELALSLNGCLSGEHGIGLDKQAYLPQALTAETRALMQAIKNQFDPLHILNPDKLCFKNEY